MIAMGLTEEQAKKVMDSLDGDFVTKSRFNEVNEENKRLKQDVSDRDKQLETLKKSTALEDLEGLESLDDIQQTSLVARKEITSKAALMLETMYTNESLGVGYYMRTMGLFATDPDEDKGHGASIRCIDPQREENP